MDKENNEKYHPKHYGYDRSVFRINKLCLPKELWNFIGNAHKQESPAQWIRVLVRQMVASRFVEMDKEKGAIVYGEESESDEDIPDRKSPDPDCLTS